MNLPPELEREIEEASEKYSKEQFAIANSRTVSTYCNSETFDTAYFTGAHFGMSLMLRKVLEDLRSDDAIVFYAPKYADNPTKPFGPNRWADWLSERYTKKESVGE